MGNKVRAGQGSVQRHKQMRGGGEAERVLRGTTGGAGRIWSQGDCCSSLSFQQTPTEHVVCGLAWEVGLGDAQSAARGTLTTHECT